VSGRCKKCRRSYHLLFACGNNEVYSVGLGTNGRLGLDKTTSVDEPE
jgi:hypothetical protein